MKQRMKQRWRIFPFSQVSLIAFCFFIGILSGTVWVWMVADHVQEEIGILNQAKIFGNVSSHKEEAFFSIWMQREIEAIFLWLIGMSTLAVPGFLLTALYGGFSISVIISFMTLQGGILGLPMYFLSIFPQAVFYIPVFSVLFFWGVSTQTKPHLAGFFILTFVLTGGVLAEIYLNPYVTGILKYIR